MDLHLELGQLSTAARWLVGERVSPDLLVTPGVAEVVGTPWRLLPEGLVL